MPEVPEADAERCLAIGALGIAENHELDNGRELAIRLIKEGHVMRFFAELAEVMWPNALQRAKENIEQGKTLDEVAMYLPQGNNEPANIKLKIVIATALMSGVPVHFADDKSMNNIQMAGRKTTLQKRHAQIRTTFLKETGALAAHASAPEVIGCLFLWGGEHFDTKFQQERLDSTKYIDGLPWVKMG